MKLKVLGSSSAGNAYILQTRGGQLLIEAGLPWREIQKGFNFDLGLVQGCIISHSHLDHGKAVKDVLRSGIECFMTKPTADTLISAYHHHLRLIEPGIQFRLGDFAIMPFPTEHDCEGSVGYLIQYRPTGEKLLFATDTYYIKHRFNGLNYILVECNYCSDILKANIEADLLPASLKNRLLESHFSLENVKGFLKANDLSQVRKIVLIHLSEGNSNAARMVVEIQALTGKDTEVAGVGKTIPLEMCPF